LNQEAQLSKNPILLFSGGLDSTTLLYNLRPNVQALLFNYGQKHVKELNHAVATCKNAGVEHTVADISAIQPLIAKGSQSGAEEVPDGHYAEESMKTTVVPNRNMIMLSLAIGFAITSEAPSVYIAVHSGDHAIYPDCRTEFILGMNVVSYLCDWFHVQVVAPYVALSKSQIVTLGEKYGVPWADSWSCYKGKEKHCGKCGTCTERKEAFHLAGVVDPTAYEV
jgi:7-cyano-7-deazaguanine synthase